MSESQGYKLGMKMGLSDKRALFDAIRERGSKREVELLMGSGAANHAFRSGLKSAAFALSKGERRPATRKKTARKKTTRKRLTTAKRPAARKASRRAASRPRYFSERQVEAWYKKVPKKVGRYEAYDSTTSYTTEEDMTSEERKDVSVWYEIPGVEDSVWILSQEYRDSPFVLSANDGSRQQFSGTLAQMKKKLASISRRERKNPRYFGPGGSLPSRGGPGSLPRPLPTPEEKEQIELVMELGKDLPVSEMSFKQIRRALLGRLREEGLYTRTSKFVVEEAVLGLKHALYVYQIGTNYPRILTAHSLAEAKRKVAKKAAIRRAYPAASWGGERRSRSSGPIPPKVEFVAYMRDLAGSQQEFEESVLPRYAEEWGYEDRTTRKKRRQQWPPWPPERKNPSMQTYNVSWSMHYLRPSWIRRNDGEFTVRGTSAEDALANARQSLKRMDLEVHVQTVDPIQDTLRASIQNILDEDWGSLIITPSERKNPSADVISYIVRGRPFTSPTTAARKLQDKLRGLSYVDRVDIDEVGDNLYELQLVGPRNFYGADGELVAGFAAEQGEIERLISFHVGPIVT